MCEINEKDLQKATGGGFGQPMPNDGNDKETVPDGYCEHYTPKNIYAEKKCSGCCYMVEKIPIGEKYACTNSRNI